MKPSIVLKTIAFDEILLKLVAIEFFVSDHWLLVAGTITGSKGL
jgi:hypothetical protein